MISKSWSGSNISGMILDVSFDSTVLHYINVRTLDRPHHIPNIVCKHVYISQRHELDVLVHCNHGKCSLSQGNVRQYQTTSECHEC